MDTPNLETQLVGNITEQFGFCLGEFQIGVIGIKTISGSGLHNEVHGTCTAIENSELVLMVLVIRYDLTYAFQDHSNTAFVPWLVVDVVVRVGLQFVEQSNLLLLQSEFLFGSH